MHITRNVAALLVIAALANSTLAGCSRLKPEDASHSSEGAKQVAITNCGKEQTFTKAPKKIVSLGVTGLAYLVAAGAEDHIITRANEWGETPAKWIGERANSIRTVPDQISMESLVSIQPDLVYGGGFSSKSLSPDSVIEKGIPAVVDAPECHYFYPHQKENESFESILEEITKLGDLLGTSEKANRTVSDLKAKTDAIAKEKLGKGRTVSYAYYYGKDDGLFSYGTKGVMGEILKTLNLKTAIDPNYHPHQGPIAPEAFVKSDPDMIIVLVGMGGATKENTLARLEEIPGYKDMKAVKTNQIFFAESSIAYASPTALYGTIELANQIRKSNREQ